MSQYKIGEHIVNEYEILPFEFIKRFINRGLTPHHPNYGTKMSVQQLLSLALREEGKEYLRALPGGLTSS